VVELFFRELRPRGVDQVWYCQPSNQPAPLRSDYRDGVRIVVPPSFGGGIVGKVFTRLCYLFLETVYLIAQLRDPPDAFLIRDKYWGAVVAWAVSRISRKKLLVWLSYPYPEHEREEAAASAGLRRVMLACRSWLGFRLLYRFAMRRADHCFVQSEEMKRDLLRWDIPADRMTPVPMGIKKATFDAVDLSVPQEQPPVVLHLGSLSAIRKLEILVDAFAIVSRQRPDVRLRFVGDGDLPEERRNLGQYVRQAGLSHVVEFTGQVPIEQAWQQVAHAAVCVSPVRMPLLRVASPTKFVEYLAFAKPTVGNDHPEHTMIARESEGALTVPWSAQDFADAILWCLDHPQEARAMGLRGRAWVQAHRTYDRLADMVYRKLVEVVEDSRAGRGRSSPVAGDAGAR
jgi:glycosyltransferase involved in cell wall biosynthesis